MITEEWAKSDFADQANGFRNVSAAAHANNGGDWLYAGTMGTFCLRNLLIVCASILR